MVIVSHLRRRSLRRRGDAMRDRRRWAEAAEAYRRYLDWSPYDAGIRVQYGHMLSELGRYGEAERAYAHAAADRPDDADIFLCRGHNHRRAGDDAAALACYEHSLSIDGTGYARECIASLLAADRARPQTALTPAYVGRLDRVDDVVIEGRVVAPPGNAVVEVEFLADDAVVGSVTATAEKPGGSACFRAVIDVDDPTDVVAVRKYDRRPLDGSPVTVARRFDDHDKDPPSVWAWLEEIKVFSYPVGREVALFVTHTATGMIKPHVEPYLRSLRANGIAIMLVVVTDSPAKVPTSVLDLADGVVLRQNKGYDFAAWAHTLRQFKNLFGASILYLVNDSVAVESDRLRRVVERVRSSTADIVGLTESFEHRWHIQSYFLALRQSTLSSFWFHGFVQSVRLKRDKDKVIRAYEVPFASGAEKAGLRTEVLFPSTMPLNPTLFGWRQLLADGFPFVKLLLVRSAFPEADTEGWRETLATAGFDLAPIDATIAMGARPVPSIGDGALSVVPVKRLGGLDRPLRVAYIGPWNYDNGLGVASRSLIGALRATGCELNLHPIETPFHVHRPVVPPTSICDFEGRADIAVVHLNPDSWFMLTGRQREIVTQAHTRIGYFVWEMGHLPDNWIDFASVDRIWAPSRYCADLFSAEGVVPVDIVPHVVDLPPPSRALGVEHEEATLGLAGRRVILYMFDGSSYLARKNPAALVRAFIASGLGMRGWSLVLKTKHLLDRPEEGSAFRDFVAGVSDVVLIDRFLSEQDKQALWAMTDIYASPHCSEGFGLTIAEALAAGKRVVATDFGGSVDFLDDTTGYPVPYSVVRLDQDFGHYRRGGVWAQVDEVALAEALRAAAGSVERNDDTIARAGRERIVRDLSSDNVARTINRSFAAVMREGFGSNWPSLRDPPGYGGGIPLAAGAIGDGLVIAPLDRRGVPDAGTTAALEPLRNDASLWAMLAPAGTLRSPDVASVLAEAARRRPDVSIFYADDVARTVEVIHDRLRLKPSFDRALLLAQDYVGAPVFIRGDALAAIGDPAAALGTAAVAGLLFAADAAGLSIERISHVLLGHADDRVASNQQDYAAMLRRRPELKGYDIAAGRAPGTTVVRRRFDTDAMPRVSLLIPTRRAFLPDGTTTYIERLLDGIAATDWAMDRITVFVGDDGDDLPDWAAIEARWPFRLVRIATPRAPNEPFNFAAKMNVLWRQVTDEHIVFMNDDLLPIGDGWLKALLTFSMDAGVGGVGARLLYEDGRLQHAGMAPFRMNAAHIWLNRRVQEGTYQSWALVHREWSAVTGALFATRRSVLDHVGGFDERFALEFNDTDLCLRMRSLGYRIVCTPDAEMIHSEKASRGLAPFAGDEFALFRSRWSGWLDADPSWHPLMFRDRIEMSPRMEDDPWYV